MINPNLSICLPSYHPEKIDNLYHSIEANFHREFELIVCGPNAPTSRYNNLIFIQDFGSPARCCNIAAAHARGQYINFTSDDNTYLNKSISRAIIKLEQFEREGRGRSATHIISAKYVEGNMPWWMMTIETGLRGYSLNTSYPKCVYVDDTWLHFNFIYLHTNFFKYLGGYDSSIFETPHFAAADLAVRAQRLGCTTELMDEPTSVVTHSPGAQGTHGPICDAHDSDCEKYIKIYNDVACQNRLQTPFDNWQKSPEKWLRR